MSGSLNIKLTKASAGSGKTYSLMNKISKLIEGKDGKGGIDPSAILATTFTVKAANELKERIRGKLLEMGRPEMAQKVSSALIGTVNGICGRLLGEYSVDAGLSPQLEVLDEVSAKAIFKKAVAPVLQEKMAELEPLAYRFTMLEEQCYGRDARNDWWTAVIGMTDKARANGFIDPATGRVDQEKFGASLEASIELVEGLYPGSEDFSLDDAVKLVEPCRDQLWAIAEDEEAAETHRNFCRKALALLRDKTWRNALPSGSLPKDHPLNPIYEALKSGVANSRQLKEDAIAMVKLMFAMTEGCLNAYQDFKKRYGLIDFTDQEMRLLELLEGNETFRKSFQERVKVVMVDEFQDTSPMQLAIFLKMNELVGNSIWVGDPKQSIYAFRGSDPVLMGTVAKRIGDADPGNIETLPYSWRSRENLVNFANAVFVESFKGTMAENEVALGLNWAKIDEDGNHDKRTGGEIESWVVNTKAGKDADLEHPFEELLADGVVAYREEHPEVPLRQMAVLTRSNDMASDIASVLAKRGVPASASSGTLNAQPICLLAMSAYRCAIDSKDTIALASLGAFAMDDDDWFARLVEGCREKTSDSAESRSGNATLDAWMSDPKIGSLLAGAKDKGALTPIELLDYVIGVFSLDEYAGRMAEPDRALRNLEALRSLCITFMQGAKLGGYPVTHSGFVRYFMESDCSEASCIGGDCVQVMTYHKSKGLEWSVVILAGLQSEPKPRMFDTGILQSMEFDPENPLAGRLLVRALTPFDGRTTGPFEKSPEYQKRLPGQFSADVEEMKRLMYVGITRARDVLVLAPPVKEPNARSKDQSIKSVNAKWLDFLSTDEQSIAEYFAAKFSTGGKGKNKVEFPSNSMFNSNWKLEDEDVGQWTICGKNFPVKSRFLVPPEEDDGEPAEPIEKDRPSAWVDDFPETAVAHLPARTSPSAEEGKPVPVEVQTTVEIGKWFALSRGDDESAALGEAMHNYYAVVVKGEDDLELAKSLLERWGVASLVTPEKLVETGVNLRKYIRERWPDGEIATEVPMTLVNENGQLYQGYIDMLVKVGGDYVLIDHKTGLSRDYQKVAEKYAGQQVVYKKAIEAATGGKVLKCVLHLPVCGTCVECCL